MTASLRPLLLGTGIALAAAMALAPAQGRAAEPAASAEATPPPQQVLLRVNVGANGRATNAQNLNPKTPAAVLQAAYEIAPKLQFTPATKNGQPVASETSLSMTLALVPRAGGGFGLSLKRAQNGPSVLKASTETPRTSRENGGVVVVGIDLLADGSVDMKSFKAEKTELRVPSTFAEERFVEAARISLKGAKFMLDKVDGIEIPSRLSVPFMFNGGMRKPERAEEERDDYGNSSVGKARDKGADPNESLPSLTAVSRIEGITLPKVDFTAPPAPAATPAK